MSLARFAGGCAFATSLLMCGCSVQPQDGGEGVAGPYSGPFDLPLESRFIDLSLYGAAVDGFMAECMARSGLEYPVGTWDRDQSAVRAYSSLGYPNLDPELVEIYGYREPRDPREIVPPADLAAVIPAGEEARYTQVQQTCTDESLGAVPDVAAPGNILLQLDAKSRDATLDDPRVAVSVERWRVCVREAHPPLGDPGNGPDEFRLSVLAAVDTRDNNEMVDTMMMKAPPDEIEAATIDVGCRLSSGYDTAYFSVIGEAQERLISENTVALEGVQNSMDEIQQAIDYYVLEGESR